MSLKHHILNDLIMFIHVQYIQVYIDITKLFLCNRHLLNGKRLHTLDTNLLVQNNYWKGILLTQLRNSMKYSWNCPIIPLPPFFSIHTCIINVHQLGLGYLSRTPSHMLWVMILASRYPLSQFKIIYFWWMICLNNVKIKLHTCQRESSMASVIQCKVK